MPSPSPRQKGRFFLLRLMVLALAVVAIATATVISIDIASFFQPGAAHGDYIYPHMIKGQLHFLTGLQAGALNMAEAAFWAGLVVFFVLAITTEWLKYRAEKRLATRAHDSDKR